MGKIDPETRVKFEQNPTARVRLIVHSKDDPNLHANDLRAFGFTIRYTYTLTMSAAIEGDASAALALVDQPWVVKIEQDRPVRAL